MARGGESSGLRGNEWASHGRERRMDKRENRVGKMKRFEKMKRAKKES